VTGSNVGKLLAVVLDNRVFTAPSIHGQINDRGQITGGNFTPQSAQDLALVLRSGALPATIKYLSEETVGPSLGADSIRHGVIASIVGLLAVMGFMLVYYRGSGINANVALILNLLILIALMGYIGAVLTLPGIAGVILTVGMGVDSNVLIFERIREELRLGKAVGAGVAAGFDQAFRTIIDTHVTTVVSAAILFAFGTGAMRGTSILDVCGFGVGCGSIRPFSSARRLSFVLSSNDAFAFSLRLAFGKTDRFANKFSPKAFGTSVKVAAGVITAIARATRSRLYLSREEMRRVAESIAAARMATTVICQSECKRIQPSGSTT